MSEKKFIVRMVQYWEYEVIAEDADTAQQIIEEGDGPREGECGGYSIDSVVAADKAGQVWDDEDDERAKCRTCGHLLYDGHTGTRYYDHRTRQNPHPRACNTYRCDCKSGVAPVVELDEAVAG